MLRVKYVVTQMTAVTKHKVSKMHKTSSYNNNLHKYAENSNGSFQRTSKKKICEKINVTLT